MTLDSGPENPSGLIGYPLGFFLTATVGYLLTVLFTADTRAKFFNNHKWVFPLLCGVLLTVFMFTGLVENSTDVVGYYIGHKYEHIMLIVSVLFWTMMAIGVVIVVDRFLSRNHTLKIDAVPSGGTRSEH